MFKQNKRPCSDTVNVSKYINKTKDLAYNQQMLQYNA